MLPRVRKLDYNKQYVYIYNRIILILVIHILQYYYCTINIIVIILNLCSIWKQFWWWILNQSASRSWWFIWLWQILSVYGDTLCNGILWALGVHDVAAAAAVARVADSSLQVFANKFKQISIEFGGFNSNNNKKKRNQRQDKTWQTRLTASVIVWLLLCSLSVCVCVLACDMRNYVCMPVLVQHIVS